MGVQDGPRVEMGRANWQPKGVNMGQVYQETRIWGRIHSGDGPETKSEGPKEASHVELEVSQKLYEKALGQSLGAPTSATLLQISLSVVFVHV